MPEAGYYAELLNSDASIYGGSNVGNQGGLETNPIPAHGYDQSLSLTLPPLGAVVRRKPVRAKAKGRGQRRGQRLRRGATLSRGPLLNSLTH